LNVSTWEHQCGINKVLVIDQFPEECNSLTNLCPHHKILHSSISEQDEFLSKYCCNEVRTRNAVKATDRKKFAVGLAFNRKDI
jgi:hypothetical protein